VAEDGRVLPGREGDGEEEAKAPRQAGDALHDSTGGADVRSAIGERTAPRKEGLGEALEGEKLAPA
jgi:hypothetical protein